MMMTTPEPPAFSPSAPPHGPRPFAGLVESQRRRFASGAIFPAAVRRDRLLALHAEIERRQRDAIDALRQDLGKSEGEAYLSEIGQTLDEVRHAARHVARWMKPRRMPGVPALWPGRCRVYPEPLGVALIFSPWNYPFLLSLLPLTAAVAAGDCAVIKPSSSAPATTGVLADILSAVFDPDHVALVRGGALPETGTPSARTPDEAAAGDNGERRNDAASALLRERFDFLFYTGSARVGRIVMEAAARSLTPVCLELGGKSPVIVAADADLDTAARRIAWGKTLNAGQTCVAPDHVWADRRIRDELKEKLNQAFRRLVGDDPLHNPDYGRIVTDRAFRRLLDLAGGLAEADPATLRIAPTLLDADPGHPAMEQEIFGPLLPVLAYDRVDEALDHIRSLPKPLALYLFTADRKLEDRVLRTVPFGGGCVNDVILHAASHHLPFGGVGESGMGRYHGRAGFDLFSNLKSVVHQRSWPDIPLRYPPFSARRIRLFRRLLR